MKIRKNILPRRLVDKLCFLLIAVFLPLFGFFELIVVYPVVHELGGFFYIFTILVSVFLVFNITANMLVCMMIDTSVDYKHLKEPPNAESIGWRHCKYCHEMAPPRSWHCRVCKSCILKRDHHCLFMGCCIGQRNQRFFIMFSLYFFVGTIYVFVYNICYLWLLIAAPLLNHRLPPLESLYPTIILPILFALNIHAIIYSAEAIISLGPVLWYGGVYYERKKGHNYDAGLRQNMEEVLGKRMHLVWLSPLVRSELPSDGINWKESLIQQKNTKLYYVEEQ